jgi:hypothetical protein
MLKQFVMKSNRIFISIIRESSKIDNILIQAADKSIQETEQVSSSWQFHALTDESITYMEHNL